MTGNDHFEFYWFPHTDVAADQAQQPRADGERRAAAAAACAWVDDELLANGAFALDLPARRARAAR